MTPAGLRSSSLTNTPSPAHSTRRQTLVLHTLIALMPMALSACFLCLKIVWRGVYESLFQEDALLENAQVVFYLAGALVALRTSVAFYQQRAPLHASLFATLGLALLGVAAEEVSWGQRFLHIATPAFFRNNNTQKELSLHNLRGIQRMLHALYMLVGAYGSVAWIAARSRARPDRTHAVWPYIVPDWFLRPYFFVLLMVYAAIGAFPPHDGSWLVWGDQELAELMLAMGMFVFAVVKFRWATGGRLG